MKKNKRGGEVVYTGSMQSNDTSFADLSWQAHLTRENSDLFASGTIESIRLILIHTDRESLWTDLRNMLLSQMEVFNLCKNELSELFTKYSMQRQRNYEVEADLKSKQDFIAELLRSQNYSQLNYHKIKQDNSLLTKKVEELEGKEWLGFVKVSELESQLSEYGTELSNAKHTNEELRKLIKMAEAALHQRDERIALGCEQYAELSQTCDGLRSELTSTQERNQTLELLNESGIEALKKEKQRSTEREFELHRRLAAANARYARQGLEECPPKLRAKLLSMQKTCMHCDRSEDLTIDRREAGRWGGRYWPHNCGVLCRSCNSKKGDATSREWKYWERPEHQWFVDACERLENERFGQMHLSFADDEDEYLWGEDFQEDEDGEEPTSLSNP